MFRFSLPFLRRLIPVWMVLSCGGLVDAADHPISFRHDVMAVFSKGGCNNGGCHGNAAGRGSLKLSLRGESPDIDFASLLESKASRLLMREDPEKSLLVRKPTLQLGHEGGRRFELDSLEYRTLLGWLQNGAPQDPPTLPSLVRLEVSPGEKVIVAPSDSVSLKVTAHFSDERQRDVSRWAVYEPSNLICEIDAHGTVSATAFGETTITVRYLHLQEPVRLAFVPARPAFAWTSPPAGNPIDLAVFDKIRKLRMTPSAPASDATFLRRVSLDLTGLLPTEAEARAFVDDPHPDKRSRLVERLLASPAFAERWALHWSDLLRNEEKTLDAEGVTRFHRWIRDSFAANVPMDAFVRHLVTGLGSTYENPPANYYRALRDPTLRAEATAQLFLGTRLQCARCHRHPYERWTQDDYYQFAAVFDGLGYEILKNERQDKLDKNQFNGEQIVQVGLDRTLEDPRSGNHPDPAFLPIPDMPSRESDDLAALAEWLTAPDNPLFARVQVNRIWFQLFGRGIVDPVDDFRSTNPPINPRLLEVLEAEFIRSGFDLRHLIRFITSSETYQFSAHPNATNGEDEENFSRTLVRRLPAETLLDALHQVLGTLPEFTDEDRPLRAVQLPGVENVHRNRRPKNDEHFLRLFGRPVRHLNSDLERSNASSLAQVFELTSGQTLHHLLGRSDNRLQDLIDRGASPWQMIHALYWSALCRSPTAEEERHLENYLNEAVDLRSALEDVAWALLNSPDFMLRR